MITLGDPPAFGDPEPFASSFVLPALSGDLPAPPGDFPAPPFVPYPELVLQPF